LPVYALIIGAFIPRRTVWGGLELQGVVLFALYVIGVASAMAVAFVLKRSGKGSGFQALMLELPAYHWPNFRNLGIGLWQRVEIFMSRVGTIILALMVILWALSSFPAPPPGATSRRVARRAIQAHRLQLADLNRAGAGSCGARGCGRRSGHRVCAIRDGRRCEQRLDAADHAVLEFADGVVAAGVVCLRSAVPVHAGDGQARDEFLALPHHHGDIFIRDGLRGILDHLPHRDGVKLMNP
jgi:hypothetical protein